MRHIPLGIIFGFVSLACFTGADFSTVSFQALSIVIAWITLIALVHSIQWFDKVSDGYFIIVILLFFAARLARYSAFAISKPCTYVAIGVGLGLVAKCIHANAPWPVIWLLSIFALEISNMELDTKWEADLTPYFPYIDFIDSKFTFDPTTIKDWNTTPSLL